MKLFTSFILAGILFASVVSAEVVVKTEQINPAIKLTKSPVCDPLGEEGLRHVESHAMAFAAPANRVPSQSMVDGALLGKR